jgi:hypothetical protein
LSTSRAALARTCRESGSKLLFSSFPNAGTAPAFFVRVVPAGAARGAEFISVGGDRFDRSALHSDMRHSKRTSGFAAATVPPHAPMNGPKEGATALPAGFLS